MVEGGREGRIWRQWVRVTGGSGLQQESCDHFGGPLAGERADEPHHLDGRGGSSLLLLRAGMGGSDLLL